MGYMKKGGAVVSNGQGKVMKDRIKTTKNEITMKQSRLPIKNPKAEKL